MMGFTVKIDTAGSRKIPPHMKAIQRHYVKAIDRSAKRIGFSGVERAKHYLTQANAIKSGAARRSIGYEIKKTPRIWTIIMGGFMKYLIFLEEGTKPHFIFPKNKKALAFRARKIYIGKKRIGSMVTRNVGAGKTKRMRMEVYKYVKHPGTKAIRFFERAMNDIRELTPIIILDELKDPPRISRN